MERLAKGYRKHIVSIFILAILVFTTVFSSSTTAYAATDDGSYVKKDILLIQSVYPWNSKVNKSVLQSIGAKFDIVTADKALTMDLFKYRVVVVANDQTTDVYDNIAKLKTQLESFVMNGGTMVYGICFGGWSNGKYKPYIPGDVKVVFGASKKEKIVDEDHPIVQAIYSDKIPLTNADLTGDSASHVYFDPATLPENTNVIINANNADKPTLVEYKIGKGTVIASGLTWEYSYDRTEYGMFSKKAFDDLYLYALSLAQEAIDDKPGDVSSVITLDKEEYKPDDTMKIEVVSNLSSYKRTVKAVLKVTDNKGNLIDTIAEIPEKELVVGTEDKFNETWKVSDLESGTYKVVIDWFEKETPVGSGEASFKVKGTLGTVKSTIALDKEIYQADDAMNIKVASELSQGARNASAVLKVTDAAGKTIQTIAEKPEQLLTAGVPVNMEENWTVSDLEAGTYKVEIEWFDKEKAIGSAEKSFKVEVVKGTVASTLTLDKEEYVPSDLMNIKVVSELSAGKRNAKAVLKVTDANGKALELIATKPEQLLKAGVPVTLEETWKVTSLKVGTYKVTVEWFDNDESVSKAEASFKVKADASLNNKLVLSPEAAVKTDDLTIKDTITNPCTNYTAKNLDVVYEIKDSSNKVVWTTTKNVLELTYQNSILLKTIVPLADFVPGDYTVTSSVYENDVLACSDTASFKVQNVTITAGDFSGKIQVKVDNDNKLTNYLYSVTNESDNKAKGVNINVKTVKSIGATAIISESNKVDIEGKKSANFVSVNSVKDTKVWPGGTYYAVLYLLNEKGEEKVLDTAEFELANKLEVIKGYSLFATEGTVDIRGYQCDIKGKVYSNDTFINKNISELQIHNTLTSTKPIVRKDGYIYKIDDIDGEADKIVLPDYSEKLIADAKAINAEYKKVCDGRETTPKKPMICDELLGKYTTTLNFAHTLIANKSTTLNCDKLTLGSTDKPIVFASLDGGIEMSATNVTINGLIYAPNDTVFIHAENLNLTGTIIAKNIVLEVTTIKCK